MTWNKLKELSGPNVYAISIDRYFPKVLRGTIRKLSAIFAALSFLASFSSLPLDLSYTDGLFFVFTFLYLLLSFLEFFYHSMKNEGIHLRIKEEGLDNHIEFEYALCLVVAASDEIDITRSIFESNVGIEILNRAGVAELDVKSFLHGERLPIIATSLKFKNDGATLHNFLEALYDTDTAFASFLSLRSINKEEFLGAADWTSLVIEKKREQDRFWGKDNLGTIPSIGTSWSYGNLSDIGKFGTSLDRGGSLSSIDIDNGFRQKETDTLENILERRIGANALVISDDESTARDIVLRLLKRIKLGTALPSLEHKQIIELDTVSLLATWKSKGEFEAEIIKIFREAVGAGNIILYIRDLASFITSGKNIGVNIPSIVSEFLSSTSVQIIAHTTNPDFHYFIESNGELLQSFERVVPSKVGTDSSMPAIIEKVSELEKDYKIVFTFAAAKALAESADRYITYGEMPEKALGLIEDIIQFSLSRGNVIVKENDVLDFIADKTGIAAGPVKQGEKDKVLNLEEILHKRLIGQNEAVLAISGAMRRSRSGIVSSKRPIASFIFLGPTGVGKTETSKALAESFFGDENKMVRFDMSEYNGADAMQRLIGNFGENKTGLLASSVRDHPYGVLLLDEFEKASGDVLDLFLQILDEGIFTDALGNKINCRNLIIIATSNAGSEYIWESIKQKKNLIEEKDKIVDSIIKDKIFRPELLNRFDGIILFHPLQNEELKKVAELELKKLQQRLKEQSYEFIITDELLNFLVEKGSDPQFGARSINRSIKTEVEDVIAKKILSSEVKPGERIEIKEADLR